LSGFGTDWSGEAHLWWIDAKPGDTLDLAVPVQKTAVYRLKMQLTKAIDYGTVQLYLDSKKLGGPIDLYNNGVAPTGVLDLGIHELDKGEHQLRIEIVGANQKAIKKYMFGIDYLKLEEIKLNFYLPENPSCTILDSARDSVRFAVERTLIGYKGHLCCKSSFVDKYGKVMRWHDFGNLEGPGWAGLPIFTAEFAETAELFDFTFFSVLSAFSAVNLFSRSSITSMNSSTEILSIPTSFE